MQERESSNSNAEEYFEKLGLKKIEFDGNISESASESHSSQQNHRGSKVKRNNYSKQISNLLKQQQNASGVQDEKTKLIKKNCVSAKMSRQRKKIYIQLLEKKVGSLKKNIINTREKLITNRAKIMHYIQQSNKQKRVYIEEKMKDSKRLIAMSEQFSNLSAIAKNMQNDKKKSQMGSVVYIPSDKAHNYLESKPQNLQPNQIPPQMQMVNSVANESFNKSVGLPAKKSRKSLKNKPQVDLDQILKQLEDKKELLELGINSYLYKFGINGILKNDVVQLLKEKWYQLVINQSILEAGKSSALEKVICDFRDSFWQIDQSNKKLDYLLRQLRDKIKPEYVVKFILQKQFFKSFSTASYSQEMQQTNQSLKTQQKIEKEHKQHQKQEKIGQDQQSISFSRQNRIIPNNQISESFPYDHQVLNKARHKKSQELYESSNKEAKFSDLDF